MTRTADPWRREELLSGIIDYVLEHGLSDLSLRPLAEAVGSSPRVLLYYWGSKVELVQAIIEGVRARQLVDFVSVRDKKYGSINDACLAVWNMMVDRKHEPLYRLFFELYGLALQDRQVYKRFLEHVVEDWIVFFSTPLIARGVDSGEARAFGTMMLAGFRGFLMDYCATRERERIEPGLKLWLEALRLLEASKENERAQQS